MPLRLESLDMPDLPASQAGQPLLLPLDAIDEDPEQPRTEFDDESLRELAGTIARRGVRQPISVRPHPDHPERWILNFGARRLRASRLAGRGEIPAFIDEAVDSYDQVIENEQREGLKPLELAMFVQRRLARGETQAEIARLLGKSQPYIVYVSALIEAPQWLLDIYREGRCRGVAELYQLRRLHGRSALRVEAWLKGRATITRADVMQLKAEIGEYPAESRPRADPASHIATQAQGKDSQLPVESPTVAVPAARAPAIRTHPAQDRNRARMGFFARMGSERVEIVLDEVPDAADTLLVRLQPDARPLAVAATSLSLVGFLPTGSS